MEDKEAGSLGNSFLIMLLMFGLASVTPCVFSTAPTENVDPSVQTNWPRFRHDNARSRENLHESTLSPSNVSCLEHKCTQELSNGPRNLDRGLSEIFALGTTFITQPQVG